MTVAVGTPLARYSRRTSSDKKALEDKIMAVRRDMEAEIQQAAAAMCNQLDDLRKENQQLRDDLRRTKEEMGLLQAHVREIREDGELPQQGVFDDFTVASSWERLISDIEAACRKWQTGFAHGYLAVDAEVVDGHGKLRQVHCDLTYGSKVYRLDFYFDTEEQGGVAVDEWKMERHYLQLWFGVQDFLVLAPLSMSGVILDAPEATLLLSAVSIALSNCGSVWPAFVPVHDPTRKAYKGIQGMRGPYCRSFEADRIYSQVPVKLMHLEGLYELFISKLAFSLPDSVPEYDGKIRSTVRLTYRTPMPGFEIVLAEDNLSPTVKPVENFDGDLTSKVPWDDAYPWAQWYTVDDPIKGFELIATWSNRLVESSLDMAEFENVSTFEADKWLLAPVITQGLEATLETSQVSFASRMQNLLEAFFLSKDAKFMEDFCTGDSPIMQKITSSTVVPPQCSRSCPEVSFSGRLDRPRGQQRSMLLTQPVDKGKGQIVSTMDDDKKQHKVARAIKGAPTNSLFAQFCLQALWFGNCNICAISALWIEFVREVRWCWEELQPLPRMFQEEKSPSFDTCLVHQKLELLAACIRRKAEEQQLHSKTSIKESLADDDGSRKTDNEQNSAVDKAIKKGGKGPHEQEGSLMLLTSPEKMQIPFAQKPPIMTEDMLLEREHALVVLSDSPSGKMTRERLQTSMLSSDMAAFKAANPCAVFEDFIRWHSPRDWLEEEVFQDSLESLSPSSSLTNLDNALWPPRGKLSNRMSQSDNTWVQLWSSVEPLPAHKQKPLFDHTREGEKETKCFKCGEQGHSYRSCPQRNACNEQPKASMVEAPKEDVYCKGSPLSYAWEKVREHDALILFDLGSTHNFISIELATKLGIQEFEMGDAMKVDVAFIGQDVSVTSLIGKLMFHIQGYVDKEDFFISPLKHEDVILGAPWLDCLAASIKFLERKISLDGPWRL
ncbi:hypothetical protein L7F22_030981 [Adiantum nelumboides]|nr:hypothetical protein [Adiantum nelumboides]